MDSWMDFRIIFRTIYHTLHFSSHLPQGKLAIYNEFYVHNISMKNLCIRGRVTHVKVGFTFKK